MIVYKNSKSRICKNRVAFVIFAKDSVYKYVFDTSMLN